MHSFIPNLMAFTLDQSLTITQETCLSRFFNMLFTVLGMYKHNWKNSICFPGTYEPTKTNTYIGN
jgi:hypothetical protein